ncbi:EXLDI protein [Sporolactobacillus sp. THM7-4]|nr:EXLDI protein [Sporolactobacillus sp. THM7-4]
MPNKTIYVPDADLPVFDQAQDVSGKNLSATIVQALRFFIKIGEGKGFDQVELTVGENGIFKRKRFIGRELASASVYDDSISLSKDYIVYETAHGRFAVLVSEQKVLPLEQSIERELEKRIIERLGGKKQGSLLFSEDQDLPLTRRLEVYESVDALNGHIPGDLFRAIHEIRDGEFLDI